MDRLISTNYKNNKIYKGVLLMKCLKCGNTDLSMMVRMIVIFPVDLNGNIYINDYEGYDDLLEEAINDVEKEDKYYRCCKCGLEWRVDEKDEK